MAMLAERRSKTKWTLNPRGKLWSEDSNKFGQKLMEKMGWTAGKGLGAKEQGITSHIHVQMKSDNSGVGFKGKDTDWCKHQANFDEILSALNEDKSAGSNQVATQSLEERSKASKARLHYHKFTRGKDVSKYSSKDLECILGVQNEISQVSSDVCKVEDIGAKDDSFGVQTIVGGSISDYLNRKQSSKNKMKKLEREDGSEDDGGGIKKRDGEVEGSEHLEPNEGTEGKENKQKRKRKKLKSEEEERQDGNELNVSAYGDELHGMEGGFSNDVVELERSGNESRSRKKRKNVLNAECVDESTQGSVCEEIGKKSRTGFVGEKKSKNSWIVTQFKKKDVVAFVEESSGNMECEQDSNGNLYVEEGGGAIVDGVQKKRKKRKSARGVKVEKCDGTSGLSTDNVTVLDDRNDSTCSAEVKGVGDHFVCTDEKGSSRKDRRKVKKAREGKSKVKSEWDHYLCVNDEKYDTKVSSGSGKQREKKDVSFVEEGSGNMECEQDSNENLYVEKGEGGIVDGIQKKTKKRKSASGVKVEKCDGLSGMSTDKVTVLDDRNDSKCIAEEQGVEDHVVYTDEMGSSRKKRKVKKAREGKSKVKSEEDRYLCINNKMCDKEVIGSSCKMFRGANLHTIKGYGSLVDTKEDGN